MNFKPTDVDTYSRIDVWRAGGYGVMVDIWEELTLHATKVYHARHDIREALEHELYICRNKVR